MEQPTAVLSDDHPDPGTVPNALIYIVDDQSSMGLATAAILRSEGFQVKWHIDPESALKYLSEEADIPILLLADFMMDPMNGLELIQRFKRMRPDMKAILFSGYDCKEMLNRQTIKPDAFITKPFDASTLISAIKSVLAK